MESNYLIHFNAHFRKVNIFESTDGKKCKNEKEQLIIVTYDYQKSKCNWNFATLFNFYRSSLVYEKSRNFLTSPNEHTVVCTPTSEIVFFSNLANIFLKIKISKNFLNSNSVSDEKL